MIIFNKKTIVLFIIFTFFSCEIKEKENVELEINYLKSSYYLKEPKGSESELPPILYLEFSVKNFTNFEKILPIKSSKFDKQGSSMFVFDSINNRILPIFCDDVIILKPNSKQNFKCGVKLRKNNIFFNIDDEKLTPRLDMDYTIHKKYFEEKCNSVIKNAILFYVHDSTDVNYYTQENKKITGFKNNTIILCK